MSKPFIFTIHLFYFHLIKFQHNVKNETLKNNHVLDDGCDQNDYLPPVDWKQPKEFHGNYHLLFLFMNVYQGFQL